MAKDYYRYSEGMTMLGPFPLNVATVRDVDDDWFGGYLIVRKNDMATRYVGQGNFRQRFVNEHLDTYSRGHYFYLRHLSSDEEMFHWECAMFHRYGKANNLDNERHPPRPAGRTRGPNRLLPCSLVGCSGEDY